MDVDEDEPHTKGVQSLVDDEAEESTDEPMDIDSDADSDGNLKGFVVSEDELECGFLPLFSDAEVEF